MAAYGRTGEATCCVESKKDVFSACPLSRRYKGPLALRRRRCVSSCVGLSAVLSAKLPEVGAPSVTRGACCCVAPWVLASRTRPRRIAAGLSHGNAAPFRGAEGRVGLAVPDRGGALMPTMLSYHNALWQSPNNARTSQTTQGDIRNPRGDAEVPVGQAGAGIHAPAATMRERNLVFTQTQREKYKAGRPNQGARLLRARAVQPVAKALRWFTQGGSRASPERHATGFERLSWTRGSTRSRPLRAAEITAPSRCMRQMMTGKLHR